MKKLTIILVILFYGCDEIKFPQYMLSRKNKSAEEIVEEFKFFGNWTRVGYTAGGLRAWPNKTKITKDSIFQSTYFDCDSRFEYRDNLNEKYSSPARFSNDTLFDNEGYYVFKKPNDTLFVLNYVNEGPEDERNWIEKWVEQPTSSEALSELKSLKEKLDLLLIIQSEYDYHKCRLKIFIE